MLFPIDNCGIIYHCIVVTPHKHHPGGETSVDVRGVITAKMRCCIMLFYYDLLDSIVVVMSSLFGIVNSIRPFCILLCNYTFYYVLYFVILTWRFRLLWWRFALSIWQCKVLYPIVQFYILLYTYMSYHPTLGYFRNFVFCFAFPNYDLLHLVDRSCIMLNMSYPAWHSRNHIS